MKNETRRSKDYLVIAGIGSVEKRMIWNDRDVLPLDYPEGWTLARINGKICLFDQTLPDLSMIEKHAYMASQMVPGQKMLLNLPPAAKGDPKRPIDLTIYPLQPIQPPYMQTSPEAYAINVPKQLMLYQGIRYFMLKYRPVGSHLTASSPNGTIFSYARNKEVYSVTSHFQGFGYKLNGKKSIIPPGVTKAFNPQDFFNAVFYHGVYWWRFRAVQTPESMAPIESEESEEQQIEEHRVLLSSQIVVSLILSLLVFSAIYGKFFATKEPIAVAKIELHPPKVIPHKEIVEPPKPKPPEPIPEPPKVVEIPKPKPPEPPPEPPKKVVKEKPKVEKKIEKKVAKKEPPPKPEKGAPAKVTKDKPTPKPPMVKADTPPASGVVMKKTEAPAPPDPSIQLLKSLSFISSAAKNSKAGSVDKYAKNAKKDFINAPTLGGGSKDSKVLDQMSSKDGDSNIKTKSSRMVSSDTGLSSSHGKGLNDVQGKVSLNQIYGNGGSTGGLDDGAGMSISGPGDLSEAEIEKALQKYLSRFQFCYEKALLTDSTLGGNIRLQWTITTSGGVASSKVVSSQLKNETLHGCILGVLKQVKFPSPRGGAVTAKKTFKFSSSQI